MTWAVYVERMGEITDACNIFVGKRWKGQLENLSVIGKTILRWILKETGREGMDRI
jgi:hypothetical protein